MSSSSIRSRSGAAAGGSSSSGNADDVLSIDDVSTEAKHLIDKVIKDVGKSSASKQLLIGGASGWMTGYLMMKVGKVAALAVGGGIILLQVANHSGYIKINWDKVFRQAEQVGNRLEETTTSKGPKFLDKVERIVDKKLDKAEELLKKKERKAKKWFYKNVLDEEEPFMFEEIHVFLASFMAGMALGIAFGLVLR